MPSRENTTPLNPASVATSNGYESGRTPLVPAFSASSVIGCWSTGILMLAAGSSVFGAEIDTPGIGPAISGLSGLELLLAVHADEAINVTTARRQRLCVLFMFDPR